MIPFRLRFDLRVPPESTTDFATRYSACLEMCEWADGLGAESIWLSEHHGDEAGYTSSPITLAAAVLSRTARITVSIAAILATLNDPVRLAEQLATLDCIAPGRLVATLGAGYRAFEFEMAGVDRSDRGRLIEECVRVLRAAGTGERFEWRGREILVTPTPATAGGLRLLLGGKSIAAARRAARMKMPFSPGNRDPKIVEAYQTECDARGYDGRIDLDSISQSVAVVLVTDAPDAAWKE